MESRGKPIIETVPKINAEDEKSQTDKPQFLYIIEHKGKNYEANNVEDLRRKLRISSMREMYAIRDKKNNKYKPIKWKGFTL